MYLFIGFILIYNLYLLDGFVVFPIRVSSRRRVLFAAPSKVDQAVPLLSEAVHEYRRANSIDADIKIRIHQTFIIPNTSQYSEKFWGYRLGPTIHLIKYYDRWEEYRPLLEKLSVNPPVSDEKFNTFCTAYLTFRKVFGHMKVHRRFIVPHDDPDWPRETWGLKLGNSVASVRHGSAFFAKEFREELDKLGFIWRPNELALQKTFEALSLFKEVYGHMDIAKDYVIPKDTTFPKHLWGFKLGFRVANVRYRGDGSASTRATFREIGLDLDHFEFDNRHWDFILLGLQTYHHIYGHIDIPVNFVVPEEVGWPQELWGLKLGYRVHNIRYRGDFVKYNATCRALLDDMGFRWSKKDMEARASGDIPTKKARRSRTKLGGTLLAAIPDGTTVVEEDGVVYNFT